MLCGVNTLNIRLSTAVAFITLTYSLLIQDPNSFDLAVEVLTELVSRHEVCFFGIK